MWKHKHQAPVFPSIIGDIEKERQFLGDAEAYRECKGLGSQYQQFLTNVPIGFLPSHSPFLSLFLSAQCSSTGNSVFNERASVRPCSESSPSRVLVDSLSPPSFLFLPHVLFSHTCKQDKERPSFRRRDPNALLVPMGGSPDEIFRHWATQTSQTQARELETLSQLMNV